MKAIVVCLLSTCVLAGCAGTIMSAGDLKNQGYQKSNIVGTTATGETRAQDKYELWWKESRETGRVVNFCLVPVVPNAGYQWAISVFVNDRQVWDHDGGYSLPGRAGLRTGIDCALSPTLPEGQMNWRVSFRWWQ
jgi:hypothetical protein